MSSDAQVDTGRVTMLPQMLRDMQWKQPVRVSTTANGTLSTAFDDGSTIDGVTIATGDRILIKNQSSQPVNGIYIVQASGAPLRAYDFDSGSEAPGAAVYVLEGTANAHTLWFCTNTTEPTLGDDNVTFVQFTGSGVDLAGIDFLVGTATGLLSAEIVAGTSPGGELGGTWASPTVDATHAGSTHYVDPMTTRGDMLFRNSSNVTARLAAGSAGSVAMSDGTDVAKTRLNSGAEFLIDGGGSVITTGIKCGVRVPHDCTIIEATIIDLNGASVSAVVDMKKRAFGGGAASSICASAKPTLSSASESTDTTLTGWTTSLSAGDILYANVDSASITTLLLVYLKVRRSAA